jgi:hypothetical protein
VTGTIQASKKPAACPASALSGSVARSVGTDGRQRAAVAADGRAEGSADKSVGPDEAGPGQFIQASNGRGPSFVPAVMPPPLWGKKQAVPDDPVIWALRRFN